MRNPLYFHLYWRTKYRKPMSERVADYLERLAPPLVDMLGAEHIASAVHDFDHIHLLVALPPGEEVERFARRFKAISAKRVNLNLNRTGEPFWQKRYLAKSISGSASVATVRDYINRVEDTDQQKRRRAYLHKVYERELNILGE